MTEPHTEPLPIEVEAAAAWRGLVKNFGTLLLGEGAAAFFGLVTFLLLARNLGPAGFGLVSVGIALVGWLSLGVDSGTEILSLRNVSRDPAGFRELAERILGLRIVTSLTVAAVYLVIIGVGTRSPSNRAVYLGFAVALPAIALNLRWIVLGIGGARAVAVGNLAARIVFLCGVVFAVVPHHAVARVPFAYATGEFVYAGAIFLMVARRFGVLVPRIDVAFWVATLRESIPVMISSYARGIQFSFDVLLIGFVLGPRDAGFFSAAQKPVLFFGTVIGLFYVSFVSSYSAAASEFASLVLRRAVRTSLVVTLPVAFTVAAVAEFVIPIAFGHRYENAAPVLAILAWKIPFSALTAPFSGLLIGTGQTVVLMRNNVITAAVTVLGNLLAVPLVGIPGAAIVGVVSSATILTLNYRSAASRKLAPPLRALLARA